MRVILKIAREQFKSLNSRPTENRTYYVITMVRKGSRVQIPEAAPFLIRALYNRWLTANGFLFAPSGASIRTKKMTLP